MDNPVHSSNHHYGYNTAYARYAGFEVPPPIWGTMQHGWAPHIPFENQRFLPGLPKFVWSRNNAIAARERGLRDVVPIGAPLLYLDAVLGPVPDPPAEPRSTIVYPEHSWELHEAPYEHQDNIAAIRERETGEVTVALFYIDARKPGVREAYERAGFRVTVHGHRRSPDFLLTQYRELAAHDRVVGNGLGTAILHGAALGRHIEVYGPEARPPQPETGWNTVVDYPQLHDGVGIWGGEARELASDELGREFLRSPSELRRILGWDPLPLAVGRVANPLVRAATRVVQRVTRRPGVIEED